MDKESKKLFNSAAWAIKKPSNRAELTDQSITPQIVRGNGWGSSFSRLEGDLPDRRHFNQILCETTSAVKEFVYGISLWDTEVDYPVNAISNANGVLYRAKKITGPSTNNSVNPTTPNNNVWELVVGSSNKPDAPESFYGEANKQNTLTVQWKAGKDNGRKITEWRVSHKERNNGTWSTEKSINYPYIEINSLNPGTAYVVRAKAYNEKGWGDYGTSEAITQGFTPYGTVPAGGDVIGLKAEAGNATANLEWTKPSDGGYPITRYSIQWADDNGSFNETNQGESNIEEFTVTGLSNGSKYIFRVKAWNERGHGDWSNIANATPVAPIITLYPPTAKTPEIDEITANSFKAYPVTSPSAEGKTDAITNYAWRYRELGDAVWIDGYNGINSHAKFTSLNDNTVYEVTYTLTTNAGTSEPSTPATVTTLTDNVPSVEFDQPTPLSPVVDYQSNGSGAIMTAKWTVDDSTPTYNINRIFWQYRLSGSNNWTTYIPADGTQITIPHPTIDVDENAYDFRFKIETSGGPVAFSPYARLKKRTGTPSEVTNLKFKEYSVPGTRVGLQRYSSPVSVKASWSLPTDGADSIIKTQYKCTFGGAVKSYGTLDGFRTSVEFSFYVGNVGYHKTIMSVRVRNTTGWGPWTSVSN